jgi:multimeric flavodoxin WrbA
MKILAIVGSPRPKGNTSYLVDRALEEAAAHGIETEKILLSQYKVNPCQGHDNCSSFSSCKQDDDIPWILDKFCDANGIILGSPVYYYNMTAQMKAFVDRNYYLYRHNISPKMLCAGLIIVGGSAGLDHTVRALRRFIKLSANIPDDRIVIFSGCASKAGEVKSDKELSEAAGKLGQKMAEILKANRYG